MKASGKGPVERATERELKKLPVDVRNGAVAAMAVAMAHEIDDVGNSATSKSMCAARLVDAMGELRALTPEKPTETRLDEITRRREQRLRRSDAAG